MPRTREMVALDMAAKLNHAETSIDQAIAATSELLAAMPMARVQAKVAASVGQDALTAAAEALTGLISARSRVVLAHDDLATVRNELGLRVTAGGDLWKLPPPSMPMVVANDRLAA